MAIDSRQAEREQLQQVIKHLQEQRPFLGDDVVNTALQVLQDKLQQLAAQQPVSDLSSQRRVVTVLFCDVAGSTKLAEGMDPESWTAIMNGAFEYLIEPVKRYEGTVARLMGDAILAFFGAPTAHEDDPQRAVLAGLAIVEGIKSYREKLLVERGLVLNVRVGINTGLAVVGDVGSAAAAEYTAMGDAVNVAARMEQTAQPGTVQIAQDTYSLIAPLFEFKALGGIQVKGKNEPVLAYQVLAAKSVPGSLRGLSGHGLSSPLVGRSDELTLAQSAVTRLFAGEGGLLLIFGEAGIGKSRLISELHKNVAGAEREKDLLWLEGHTLSYGRNISYRPFQEMLRGYAGIREEDGEDEAWIKLEARVQPLFAGETTEILPYLAGLLNLDPPADYERQIELLDAEALGRQVYRASRRFFQRLARQKPLVLMFDDLHWMDASSTALLEHLLPLTEQVPLLICALSRHDPQSAAVSLQSLAQENFSERFVEIDIIPLSTGDSDRLIHNLLDVDNLPAHIRRRMISKADGNPFFLEEIVRELIEAGALLYEPANGRWRATAAAENVEVPDTIQGLMLARIDRLEDGLKQVVRRAAVIGRTFLFRVISAVVEDDRGLDHNLLELQQFDFIREKQQIPEIEYIFKHGLVQEAAYDSILLQERKVLHARVGEAIELLMADRLDEFYGVLAFHYSAAEQWPKAQDYLFKAGDQAWRMAADAEALAHYQQALQALTRVRGQEWEPIDRALLDRKMGEALYRLGHHNQARPHLEQALALLGEVLPATKWGTHLALLRELLVQFLHRLLPRFFVQPMHGAQDPAAEEIYLASMALGYVEILADVERYLLLNVLALNSSESRGYPFGSAALAANMGMAFAVMGLPKLTLSYVRQGRQYAAEINPARPVPQLDLTLVGHYNLTGDLHKMGEYALLGMEIALEAGDLRGWGIGAVNLVWSFWGLADYEQCMAACEELLLSADESSDRQVAAWAFTAYGSLQRRLGLFAESINSLIQALDIAQDLPDWPTVAGAGGWMGGTLLAMGDVQGALQHMERIEKILSAKNSNMPGYVYLGNGLVEAYLVMAEAAEGEGREQWLKQAGLRIRRVSKEARRVILMRSTAYMLRGRYEWLRGRPKEALKWWSRALALAEEIGMPWEKGMIHLEIGRYLGDKEHLQSAVTIFDSIGAGFDLAQAQKLLEK